MSATSSPSSPDITRKRPRSQTESTNEQGTAYKRGASEDMVMRSASELPDPSLSAVADPSVNAAADAIDSYMAEQGEVDATPLHLISASSTIADSNASCSSSSPNPHPQQQFTIIRALKDKSLVEGDVWFLVSKKWFSRWEDACTGRVSKDGSSSEPLGPIDNTDITQLAPYPGKEYDLILEPPVVDGETAELVPQQAHELFESWYGPTKYPYKYTVTPSAPGSFQMRVELYPRRLRLYRISPQSTLPPVYFTAPSHFTLSEITQKTEFRPDMELYQATVDFPWGDTTPLAGAAFWERASDRKILVGSNASTTQLSKTVADSYLEHGDSLVAWASQANATPVAEENAPVFGQNDYFKNLESARGSTSSSDAITVKKETSITTTISNKLNLFKAPARARGTVGLSNLGNTCFMNSALQCLVHLPELTEYFLRDVYKSELNPDNPLSTGGVLAKSYADLVRTLFNPGASSSCAPREFKHRIGTHAPQFSGYAQHDSQELLAFLLDGLHEDLNRVLKKPYVEKPEWEGGGKKEFLKLAQDSWEGYMKRNDSVIVDLFQGQYKSTLVCPECQKVSITFDPFMYLTLPLPVRKTWSHEVFFIPWDATKPNASTKVELPANSSIKALKQKIATMFNAEVSRLFATDFWQGKWYKVYSDSDMVTEIGDRDTTVIYELPLPLSETASTKNPEAPLLIPLYHVVNNGATHTTYSSFRRTNYNDSKPFGMPTFVLLDPTVPITQKTIYAAVVDQYRRWTSRADHLYQWAAPEGAESSAETTETQTDSETTTDDEVTADAPETQTSDITMSAVAEPAPQLVGPKADLFSMTIREAGGYGKHPEGLNVSQDGDRPVPWADRQIQTPEPAPEPTEADGEDITETDDGEDELDETPNAKPVDKATPPPADAIPLRLKPSDVIRCEWDPHALEYYFGLQGKGEGALWERFTPHVDAAEEASQAANASAAAAAAKKNITLEDCLDEFTKEELLGEDDLWYCPQCKKHQQATKQFQLWKIPDVLVVHLKRFSSSRSLRDKIDALVEFPIQGLDLSKWAGEKQFSVEWEQELGSLEGTGLEGAATEPVVYDLFAVDEHLGGLGGGHYRAYALNADDNQWYHYDDSHVSKSKAEDAINSNAYLLFYRKRTSRPIGGSTHERLLAAAPEPAAAGPDDAPTSPSISDIALRPAASGSTMGLDSSVFHGPELPMSISRHDSFLDGLPAYDSDAPNSPMGHIGPLDSISNWGGSDRSVHSRRAPSPSSSMENLKALIGGIGGKPLPLPGESDSDIEGGDEPWIRRIGGGENDEAWAPRFGLEGRLRRPSDASDHGLFDYGSRETRDPARVDILPPIGPDSPSPSASNVGDPE